MTATIPAGVENARDLVGPAISAAVDRLSPEVRAVASYHLGLTDSSGRSAFPAPRLAGCPLESVRPRW